MLNSKVRSLRIPGPSALLYYQNTEMQTFVATIFEKIRFNWACQWSVSVVGTAGGEGRGRRQGHKTKKTEAVQQSTAYCLLPSAALLFVLLQAKSAQE
jgi:hypothetical protein